MGNKPISIKIIVISKYRIFLMKYLNITKTKLLEQLSNRLDIPVAQLHLTTMKTEENINTVLMELKNWKKELTGSKRLPNNVNPRDYAKKLLGEYKMKVVEIFNSIDGEGKRTGELTTFIRLYGCNLRCDYCDTKYSYEQENESVPYKELSITEIIQECDKYDTDNITVTGGEPLIQLDIQYLLRALSEAGYNVNVETNGSVSVKKYFNTDGTPAKGYENVWFTIDYKCAGSGQESKMLLDNFDIKKNNYHNVVYKFVVSNEIDLNTAYTIIQNKILDNVDRNNLIYISPVYNKIEPKQIVEYMQKTNLFNAKTPIRCQVQLHKIIWDAEQRRV